MAGPGDGQATASNDEAASALWPAAVQALQTFRGLHDHLDVPVDFVVPTTAAWPASTHGLQLGRRVASLRTQPTVDPVNKATLDALGFDWKPVVHYRRWSWAHRFEALCLYREEHGDLAVPTTYVVPASNPRHLHHLPLGRVVNNLRFECRVHTPERVQRTSDLDALGFLWRLRSKTTFCVVHLPGKRAPLAQLVAWSDQIEALVVFQRLNGHANVPDGFVVPPDADVWPLPMHYVALDLALASLRAHVYELPEADAQRLREAGFFADLPDFVTFLKLLDMYRTEFGTCAVHIDFVVPQSGGFWMNAWRGLALGDLAWSVGLKAQALKVAQRCDLEGVGFVFNVDATWANVLRGLEHFSSLYGAMRAVPMTFVAPSTWPDDLVGLQLGRFVERMHTAKRLRLLPPATAATFATLTMIPPVRMQAWEPPDATNTPPVVVPPSPVAVPLPSVAHEQPAARAISAPEVDSDANERCDHLVALDLWLHATPRPSESTLLGAISPACPVALRSMSVAALLLELEVGQAFEHLQPALDARQFDRQARWAITFQALAMFKAFHGHLDVPQTFSVDVSVAWPASTHCLRLGDVVFGLRRLTAANITTTIVAQLNAIDFGWADLPVAVAADDALLLAPEPPASIADAAPVASVQDVHATASARGALPSISDDVEGGSDRDDDDRSDMIVLLDSDNDNQSDADNHDIIDLCSTDEDTDDDMGIDHDVNDDDATDAIPAQDVSVDVRRRPDSLESPAPPVVQAMGRASDDDAPLAADDYPAPPNFLAMKQAVGGDHIVAASSLAPRPAETGCEYPAPPQLPARNRLTPLYPGPPRLPASSTRPFL
ncbi:hypothetical protein SPRG_03996 [Saprolegnia parasitica CBS 223.65]|uniref:Helicase-associated domain-containing protein n=1 Tax=Saprolegnia parasitica (strain CBS 223.65) TaxID=695850 RepID=A0A067CKY4_SAPPC|nr:hypothetical protein SPRG_03996 [Saprolegnia parasitica CBS 223.65]KDO31379.1 hypothetical protein SPRG_03996 [Saprolegnia parasitica CBS 223.65]|eukprot:XP_012197976.1 hypothetical protein SPRG_03996 [Saprolegnia parasitica CBS 223.65]